MPHVLTLVEQFWHKVPGGTAQATERTLAALLDRNEFTITGLAAAHRRRSRLPAGWAGMPDGARLVHHRLPRPVLYESWLRLGRPMVDDLMSPDSLFWASSLIVAPCRRPVVATVHDLDFLDHPEYLSRRGRGFFPRMWTVARSRSEHFVCPSEAVADQVRAQGVAEARISVVPWGSSPPRVRSDEAVAVLKVLGGAGPMVDGSGRTVNSLPNRFVLLVAPDFGRKNPEGCAAALAANDAAAVIVGQPPDGGTDCFAALGSQVVRVGPLDDRTLSALYHQADALLFPSHREGFGLPVLEAMAHGLPVITSRATATEEVAAGAAALVDPSNHEDIAAALAEVLSDGRRRKAMIARGRDRAAELTWDRTAKAYSEIFRSVL